MKCLVYKILIRASQVLLNYPAEISIGGLEYYIQFSVFMTYCIPDDVTVFVEELCTVDLSNSDVPNVVSNEIGMIVDCKEERTGS